MREERIRGIGIVGESIEVLFSFSYAYIVKWALLCDTSARGFVSALAVWLWAGMA